MLIDKIRKNVGFINSCKKEMQEFAGTSKNISTERLANWTLTRAELRDSYEEMAQALIAVDNVLKRVERLDNLIVEPGTPYHTVIVKQIRAVMEPTNIQTITDI